MTNYITNHSNNDSDFDSIKGSIHTSKPKSRPTLATPQSRLIAYILDGAIFGCTLGVGWIIWFFTLAGRGTTPGHELMGHQVRDIRTGLPASAAKMVIRECIVKGVISWTLASFTALLNYVIDGAMIFREDRRAVHDHLLGTEVVQIRKETIFEKLRS